MLWLSVWLRLRLPGVFERAYKRARVCPGDFSHDVDGDAEDNRATNVKTVFIEFSFNGGSFTIHRDFSAGILMKCDIISNLSTKISPGDFLRLKKNMKSRFLRPLISLNLFGLLLSWSEQKAHRFRRNDVHALVLDDHEDPDEVSGNYCHGVLADGRKLLFFLQPDRPRLPYAGLPDTSRNQSYGFSNHQALCQSVD